MPDFSKPRHLPGPLAVLLLVFCQPAGALQLAEDLELHGVLAASLQCQRLSESAGADDRCRSVVPFQPEIEYTPSPTSTPSDRGTIRGTVVLDGRATHAGADAVLFVTINRWYAQYAVLSTTVTVQFTYRMVARDGTVIGELARRRAQLDVGGARARRELLAERP